jgi:DNA-binding response OmpR family regulator
MMERGAGSLTLSDAVKAANRPRVLLAEDDVEMRWLLARTLRQSGYRVSEAADGRELIALIGSQILRAPSQTSIDLVVSDIRMPGLSGLNVLMGLRRARWDVPVLLITGFGDSETHTLACRLDAQVLDKPFDLDDFRSVVGRLVRQAEAPAA